MYKIPERLKNMEVYEPVTGDFRIRLDANESFLDLPDFIREEVGISHCGEWFGRTDFPDSSELSGKRRYHAYHCPGFFHV